MLSLREQSQIVTEELFEKAKRIAAHIISKINNVDEVRNKKRSNEKQSRDDDVAQHDSLINFFTREDIDEHEH